MQKEKSLEELVQDTVRLGLLEYFMGETEIIFGSQFLTCYDQGQQVPEKLRNNAFNRIDKFTKGLIVSIKNMLKTNVAKAIFKLDVKYVDNFYLEMNYQNMRNRAEYYLCLALTLKALKETKNVLKAEKLLEDYGLDYVWNNCVLESASQYLDVDNFQLELPDADEVFTSRKEWQNQNNAN